MKISKIDYILSIGILIIVVLWFTGTETFSGDICNYWRCIDMRVMIIPWLGMMLLILSWMNILMKKFEL
jgi:hypothetical protein